RQIEIKDGRILSDTRRRDAGSSAVHAPVRQRTGAFQVLDRGVEAFRMALRAMGSHKLRTFLTMLGIIIGIASVVSVVALGQGSQQMVLENIASIGTNTINIYPGSGF